MGVSESLAIVCSNSIPAIVPVVPWHLLITEKQTPPTDKTFVQLVQLNRKSTTIKDIHDKYEQYQCLKALVVIGNCPQIPIKDFSPTVPILFISPDKLSKVKQIFHRNNELRISSVPLSSSETKQKSEGKLKYYISHFNCFVYNNNNIVLKLDFSIISDSEQSYSNLFVKVCNSIRDNIVMSTCYHGQQRLLFYILSRRNSIGDQVRKALHLLYSIVHYVH